MVKDKQGYNGWTNWATWNTHLWITNYEDTYDLACQAARRYRDNLKGFRNYVVNLVLGEDWAEDLKGERQNINWGEIRKALLD